MKPIYRSMLILFILLVCFAAPGFFAYLFFKHPNWLGDTTTNHGELLKPPVLLSELGNARKWRLVYLSPDACDTMCLDNLDKLSRIRLALGRHFYDVDLYLVLENKHGNLSLALQNILKEKNIHVIQLSDNFKPDSPLFKPQASIFIANPTDYLVLKYQLTDEPDSIYQDIKQLLSN